MSKSGYYVRHDHGKSEHFQLDVDAKRWAMRQSELLTGYFHVFRAFNETCIATYRNGNFEQ